MRKEAEAARRKALEDAERLRQQLKDDANKAAAEIRRQVLEAEERLRREQASARPPIVPPPAPAACGWYAIAHCSRDAGEAQARTRAYAGYVINTSNYRKFSPGWFCVVQGPMGHDAATAVVDRMKRAGAATAYAKNSC